jgi:transcriptional regulator with XRE-family HTH domain
MKKKPQETLAVFVHRARARPQTARPIPMQLVLDMAGVSPQWWSRLARGLTANPSPDLLAELAAALGVPQAPLKRALAETLRRAAKGLEV